MQDAKDYKQQSLYSSLTNLGKYYLWHTVSMDYFMRLRQSEQTSKACNKKKYMYDTTMWMAESVEDVCFFRYSLFCGLYHRECELY